jgi:hypothetical protein
VSATFSFKKKHGCLDKNSFKYEEMVKKIRFRPRQAVSYELAGLKPLFNGEAFSNSSEINLTKKY